MNRRNFLGALVGGVATAAAVRTWPFRVYSFPADPQIITPEKARKMIQSVKEAMEPLAWQMNSDQETAFEEVRRLFSVYWLHGLNSRPSCPFTTA